MAVHQTTVLARPIEASAMYERVVDRIHRAIHLGQLLPGDKLPPERVLAEQLKVSRVTLREALRVLEGEGYVQTRLGARGSQTVSTPPISTEDMRRRLLSRLDATDSILEFREATESHAARLAAARRDPADLEALEGALTEMSVTRNVPEFRRSDSAFHLAVADAARNPILRSAIEDARAAMFLPIDAFPFNVMLTSSMTSHSEIFQAIRDSNGRGAEDAMRAHIVSVHDELRIVLGVKKAAG